DTLFSMEELEKVKPEKFHSNDIGSSNLFYNMCCDVMRYVPERKSFMIYNGKYWEKDLDDLQEHEQAMAFAFSMLNYINMTDLPNKDEISKYYSRYLSRQNRKKLIEDSKGIYPLSIEKFDRQPYLFNCQNGTVDLVMVIIRSHDPMDYVSKISNVWYDPEAEGDDWYKFAMDIMQNDDRLIEYLQRCLGYSISAATFQECFFIAYGKTTRNGKGTLDGTIQYMLGDYAKAADPSTFEG